MFFYNIDNFYKLQIILKNYKENPNEKIVSLINGAYFSDITNYEQNNFDRNELEIIHCILELMKEIIFQDDQVFFKKLEAFES